MAQLQAASEATIVLYKHATLGCNLSSSIPIWHLVGASELHSSGSHQVLEEETSNGGREGSGTAVGILWVLFAGGGRYKESVRGKLVALSRGCAELIGSPGHTGQTPSQYDIIRYFGLWCPPENPQGNEWLLSYPISQAAVYADSRHR